MDYTFSLQRSQMVLNFLGNHRTLKIASTATYKSESTATLADWLATI